MRNLGLRGRLLLLVVAVPAMLTGIVLLVVSRDVERQMHVRMEDNLQRSTSTFVRLLEQRARSLRVVAQVIVRDPRFFAAVALPGASSDPQARATVRGVAQDFQRVADADLFEVLDQRGRPIVSVGRGHSTAAGRERMRKSMQRGNDGLLVEGGGQWQVVLTPIHAGGERVGSLLLGAPLDREFAADLRRLTRSEVTFLAGDSITASSLDDPARRAELLDGLTDPRVTRANGLLEIGSGTGGWLLSTRPLPGGPTGSRYVVQHSLGEERARVREVQADLLRIGLLAVLAALAIGLLFAERLTRPLRLLVSGAEAMERGDYDVPLGPTTHDEIGYLAHRFAVMRRHEQAYVHSLEEVDKLKSEFISLASHELRTPISVIKGWLDLFDSLGPVSDRQKSALKAIEESLQGLIRLNDDATRVAQVESERLVLDRAPHDVSQLVKRAIAVARADAPARKVRIAFEPPRGMAAMDVDGLRLEQAIANLVRNGIRFTPDGGRVEITLRVEGDDLQIRVRDTGVGIPENRQKDLFRHAFVVRESLHHHSSNHLEFGSCGLGFGLAIAHGIVAAHGGRIEVKSRESEGSLFVIHLPIDPVEARRAA